MKKGFSFTLRVSAITITALFSANTWAHSLSDVYGLALRNDSTFQAAHAARWADREGTPQAWATLLPEITGVAETSTQDDVANIPSYNTYRFGLTLNQQVFRWDLWRGLCQAHNTEHQSEEIYVAAQQELILRVAERYFSVLSAEDTLHFSRAERKAFERQLDQTTQRFDVGLIAITDVHEAKFRRDNALAQELAAENDVEDAREQLQEITRVPVGTLDRLAKSIPLERPQPQDLHQWVDQAVHRNPTLKAARYGVQALKNQVQIEHAGHYPTIDLSGNIFRGKTPRPPIQQQPGTTRDLTLRMEIPIFSGGGTISRVREAHYDFMEGHANLVTTARSTVSNTRQAYRGVMTQISQVRALEQAVISSQSALEATTAAYEVGSRTIVDVLDAQSNLFNAQRDSSQARYNYILEGLRLKQAAGILDPRDVHEIDKWLTPHKRRQKPVAHHADSK